ncbi:MAG: hypothetical protein GC159_23160 [Phycisphaera sp.]|nr:hypothetical protein [Phycisphaera sp.]
MQDFCKFDCPKCHTRQGVPAKFIGRIVQCGTCGDKMRLHDDRQTTLIASPRRSSAEAGGFFNADAGFARWTASIRPNAQPQV